MHLSGGTFNYQTSASKLAYIPLNILDPMTGEIIKDKGSILDAIDFYITMFPIYDNAQELKDALTEISEEQFYDLNYV